MASPHPHIPVLGIEFDQGLEYICYPSLDLQAASVNTLKLGRLVFKMSVAFRFSYLLTFILFLLFCLPLRLQVTVSLPPALHSSRDVLPKYPLT